MRPARSMIFLSVLLLAGACSRPLASAARPAEEIRGADLFVSCADIFRPGTVIDAKKAATACHDVEGKARTPQYIRCTDGRHLWRIDATLSPAPGWGFTGNVFYASADLENDPALAEAMTTCRH